MSRIIAGSAKGRSLDAPKGQSTRPTADRVREALFTMLSSWLGTVDDDPSQHLAGIRFLDLYSGSGAVALEAASRGAAHVVAVEKDAQTSQLITHNSRSLNLPVNVRTSSVARYAEESDDTFDVVYVDPPYDVGSGTVDAIVTTLAEGGRIAPRALVVLERSKRSEKPRWHEAFEENWERSYGETILYFGVTHDEESA